MKNITGTLIGIALVVYTFKQYQFTIHEHEISFHLCYFQCLMVSSVIWLNLCAILYLNSVYKQDCILTFFFQFVFTVQKYNGFYAQILYLIPLLNLFTYFNFFVFMESFGFSVFWRKVYFFLELLLCILSFALTLCF